MRILYFASLKENLNTSDENINFSSPVTISFIKEELINKYGEQFPKNLLCAVNHEIASEATIVNNEDEVAFFPPVTGG